MKLCVFSDIHGNEEAIVRLLEYEDEFVDLYLFLGDIFGYFYGQKAIINVLRSKRKIISLKGNHDNNYIQALRNPIFRDEMCGKYGNSYRIELDNEELDFIVELPEYYEFVFDGKKICAYHGGPKDYLNQRIYPDTNHIPINNIQKYDYVFVGHTHYQMIKQVDNSLIVNPGSIGQPRDGKGFSYCVLDSASGLIQFKTVSIDITKMIKTVKKNDFSNANYKYLSKKYGGDFFE